MKISADDLDALRYAKSLLENPGLVAKITNAIGRPIEKGLDLLPQKWSQVVVGATRKSLEVTLQVALTTMGDTPKAPFWESLPKFANDYVAPEWTVNFTLKFLFPIGQ